MVLEISTPNTLSGTVNRDSFFKPSNCTVCRGCDYYISVSSSSATATIVSSRVSSSTLATLMTCAGQVLCSSFSLSFIPCFIIRYLITFAEAVSVFQSAHVHKYIIAFRRANEPIAVLLAPGDNGPFHPTRTMVTTASRPATRIIFAASPPAARATSRIFAAHVFFF